VDLRPLNDRRRTGRNCTTAVRLTERPVPAPSGDRGWRSTPRPAGCGADRATRLARRSGEVSRRGRTQRALAQVGRRRR
jgi:hypothetical protein